MLSTQWIDKLAAVGRYTFTTREAQTAFGSSLVATRATLRRLKEKGEIAMPYRGFYVIVPPEYRALSCLPPEQFIPQLMFHLKMDYYVGLLSAAQFHGAAHQKPQSFQVVTVKNRPTIDCGKVRVVFVARNNLRTVPTVSFNTPRGGIKVSSPEATALDLITHASTCGGLEQVASVLDELAESIDAEKLGQLADTMVDKPVIQRLGYLFERLGKAEQAKPLAMLVTKSTTHVTPLLASAPMQGSPRDRRWRVAVNTEIEVE